MAFICFQRKIFQFSPLRFWERFTVIIFHNREELRIVRGSFPGIHEVIHEVSWAVWTLYPILIFMPQSYCFFYIYMVIRFKSLRLRVTIMKCILTHLHVHCKQLPWTVWIIICIFVERELCIMFKRQLHTRVKYSLICHNGVIFFLLCANFQSLSLMAYL